MTRTTTTMICSMVPSWHEDEDRVPVVQLLLLSRIRAVTVTKQLPKWRQVVVAMTMTGVLSLENPHPKDRHRRRRWYCCWILMMMMMTTRMATTTTTTTTMGHCWNKYYERHGPPMPSKHGCDKVCCCRHPPPQNLVLLCLVVCPPSIRLLVDKIVVWKLGLHRRWIQTKMTIALRTITTITLTTMMTTKACWKSCCHKGQQPLLQQQPLLLQPQWRFNSHA